MDLDAVRTFVAVADAGQFSGAAVDLSVIQQAVSKRIAGLEKDLGVRLFTRTARGAQLTMDGRAFLPHARDLLQAAERAAPGTEWAAYYCELAAAFGFAIDTAGPNFGTEPLVDGLAGSRR
jgi:DNA-binding transcriptional LysR family regulator